MPPHSTRGDCCLLYNYRYSVALGFMFGVIFFTVLSRVLPDIDDDDDNDDGDGGIDEPGSRKETTPLLSATNCWVLDHVDKQCAPALRGEGLERLQRTFVVGDHLGVAPAHGRSHVRAGRSCSPDHLGRKQDTLRTRDVNVWLIRNNSTFFERAARRV